MFYEGSKYLYEATRKRAYFDKVTIIVPKTWTHKSEYKLPGNLTFDYADVIVAPPNPRWAPLQYTKQYQGCGQRGVHIHFMDEFLTDPEVELYYGPLGRVLVHEWGHLRWGLFDEYPDAVGDPDNYQEFYFSPLTQQFEGVRCSYDHNAFPLKFFPESQMYRPCNGGPDIGYEEGCVYYVVANQDKDLVSSSIMFSSYPLGPIKYFCDNDSSDSPNLHNREAPNKHNRLCTSRSNWEVLRDHEDFRNNINPPREISEDDLMPEITIVQHQDIRVVLLLDTSGSMTSKNRFNKMISSSANYISSIVTEGSYIGIVEFNYVGIIRKNLTLVTSDDDRQALLESLPPDAGGSTAIGDGLLKSIEVLSEGGMDPAGGIILLITDGKENVRPNVADIMDTIISSGVIVDTLAFSQNADGLLPGLSQATGGKTYFYSDEVGSNTLYEAFAATMERGDVLDSERRVQLMGTSWSLKSDEERTSSIFLDSTLGRNTEFVFSWETENVLAIDVNITRPNGSMIDWSYEGYGVDISFRILTVSIKGQAEAGSWKFKVWNNGTQSQDVVVTIYSYPASNDVEPIIVTSELSGSTTAFEQNEPLVAYAEIRQGFRPMIYANVWATIERPQAGYEPIKLQLLDNGAGADVTKNDGVYSRYFTEMTGVGYYGVTIDVDNNEGNAIVIDSNPFSKSRPIVDPDDAFNLPDIGGVKIPSPGEPPAEPTGTPAPAFSRGTSGGSSRVDATPPGFSPGADLFPPGDILDLRVTNTSFLDKTVSLAWTASGDDLDSGAASWYEVIRAESVLAWQSDPDPESHLILNSSHVLQGNLSAPQVFGSREDLQVMVPVPEEVNVTSYAFVLRAFDDAGRWSEFSNVVQAVLREYVPESLPAPAPATTNAPPATSNPQPATGDASPVMTDAPPTTRDAPPVTTDAPPPTTDAPIVVTVTPPSTWLQWWHIALMVVGGSVGLSLLIGLILCAVLKGIPSKATPVSPIIVAEAGEHTNRAYAHEWLE
ncbi:calcium-activated chloride channel regulator 1-like isoform X2 [Patiria miniata]|nr:calcium-activated chloride channel regulator 1-like isoform X2 [Patiria miniata]